MDKQKELNAIQDAWKQKHLQKGYKRFIYDGIVDPALWENQKTPRVCFLLKEAYTSGEEGYHMDQWLAENEEPWKMWNKVAVWTKAIHSAFSAIEPFNYDKILGESKALIHSIAAVNIKKSNGKATSDYDDIWKYANDDHDEIYKELKIIEPEIIVCGYTLGYLKKIIENHGDKFTDMNTADSMFGMWGDTLVIDYYHPACRYPNAVNYYALTAVCETAKKQGCCEKYEKRVAVK